MKKLSEIGREVVELSDMEFVDPDTVDWGDEPETKKFTVISDAERREFAEALIDKWENYAIEMGYGRDYGISAEMFKDFLKNEGL